MRGGLKAAREAFNAADAEREAALDAAVAAVTRGSGEAALDARVAEALKRLDDIEEGYRWGVRASRGLSVGSVLEVGGCGSRCLCLGWVIGGRVCRSRHRDPIQRRLFTCRFTNTASANTTVTTTTTTTTATTVTTATVTTTRLRGFHRDMTALARAYPARVRGANDTYHVSLCDQLGCKAQTGAAGWPALNGGGKKVRAGYRAPRSSRPPASGHLAWSFYCRAKQPSGFSRDCL